MKVGSKVTIWSLGLSILTAVAFMAVTTGSLAWYAYSRTTSISYVGTSVAKSVLLNVGIVDDDHWISDIAIAEYELERVEVDEGGGVSHSIVFTHSTNGLDYRAIRAYLFNSPYAVSLLHPITTRERALNSTADLSLYKSPDYGDTVLSGDALESDYAKIPFAFRLDDQISGQSVPATKVWMTDVTVQTSGDHHIDRAVRVFVESDISKFLMKPEDRGTTAGYTNVSGVLDLDGDGTYDFIKGSGLEMYYGDYTGTLTHADTTYNIPKETAQFDNFNDVAAEYRTQSTFYSKHNQEAKIVDKTSITPKRSEFQTFGTVKPSIDSAGKYYAGETGIPITQTSTASGVAYVTLTIFIEGWDHAVIDSAAGYSFNLGLKFEVNKS